MKNILLLVLLIGILVPIELSYAISPNAIVIYGKMSDSSGGIVQIKMHAGSNTTQSSSILVGKGAIIQRDNNDSILQSVSFNIQSNTSTNANVVDFTGNVTRASDPNMIGKPISITTDASTGYATLTFGYSNYTGIENVIIK